MIKSCLLTPVGLLLMLLLSGNVSTSGWLRGLIRLDKVWRLIVLNLLLFHFHKRLVVLRCKLLMLEHSGVKHLRISKRLG